MSAAQNRAKRIAQGLDPDKPISKGGRPKGSWVRDLAAKRTREVVAQIGMGGTPLDVMLDNMMFWHRQALNIGDRIEKMVVNAEDPKERAYAMRTLTQYLNAREQSQRCAEGAAPFCHAKLHNVSPSAPPPRQISEADVPPDPLEASRIYKRLVSGGD